LSFLQKVKSAATEAAAQKTQAPIIAKLVYVWCVNTSAQVEFAFFIKLN
jgi:hypothetical protein